MELNSKSEINNKAILMRKSLKSIINQTRLNLSKKIKKLKQSKNQTSIARKESELECFKRIKPSDVSLHLGAHPQKLKKTLTMPHATELEKAIARILLSPLLQSVISEMTTKHGVECVENFLKDNEKNILKNSQKKSNQVKKVPDKTSSESDESEGRDEHSSKDKTQSEKPSIIEPAKKKQTVKQDKPMTAEKPAKKKQKVEIVKKSIDSFFVDSSGQNYNASVSAAMSSGSDEEDTRPINNLNMRSSHNIKRFKAPFAVVQRYDRAELHDRPVDTRKVEVKEPPQEDITELHPSWKAKAQMRKTQIQAFKGTKIKFDE